MRPYRYNVALAASAIGLIVMQASSAYAQTVPSSARPEFIQRQYETEERPELTSAPIVTDDTKAAKEIKSSIQFTLKSVEFEGLTQFSAGDMKPFYEDKIGKRIALSDLNAIAANITAFYRNNGYILTRAIIPPQRIESGNVTIRIVEGFVSDVRVEGDVAADSVIHEYAAKIKASKPLNAKDLERYLLLMEDLPGVSARAVLRPSASTPGASDVVVNISRKKVEGTFALDNRGSRFLGQEQGSATLAGNNWFGMDEQTQFRVLNSVLEPTELQYFELRHEQQLGSEGTKLAISGNYALTHPGASITILDVDGASATGTVGLTHPLQRSRQSNWFANTDFTVKNSDVQALNLNLYRDKLRVWTVGTSYDFMDSMFAVNRFEASAAKGFTWWTDTGGRSHSRGNGETSFFKLAGKVTRIQPISGPWSLFASATGQYSADPLLSAEEFALGGAAFGSAYDSAELTGDHGLAGRLELQYSKNRPEEFFSAYQLYGFYDIGRVWNRNIIVGTEAGHASLASAGLGSRFNITEAMTGGLEFAVPLTREVAANGTPDGDQPRIFFNLQYRY